MKLPILLAAAAAMIASPANAVTPSHQVKAKHPPRAEAANKADSGSAAHAFFHPSETRSTGTVTVGGQPIAFDAVAGTLLVRAKEWEDTDTVEADADSNK